MESRGAREGFSATVHVRDRCGAIALVGELDLGGAEQFVTQLRAVPLARLGRVEVDAGRLTFIDSAGLRALLLWRAECERHGVAFHVTAMSHVVERIMRIAGVDDLLGAGAERLRREVPPRIGVPAPSAIGCRVATSSGR